MPRCVVDVRTGRYLPNTIILASDDFDTTYFAYDHSANSISCKLFTFNPYRSFLQELYPSNIDEDKLTNDMLDVLHSYTDSRSNECYMKTNLSLLSGDLDHIDWDYVNKLRSLIRGLVQSNIRQVYYRGLTLSDTEIVFYQEKRNEFIYTNSFWSFTTDRLLIYVGNAVMILRTDMSTERAKKNVANIWKWSAVGEEKEALLAMGTKLRIISVHQYGCKWEIEVELIEDDDEDNDDKENLNC